MALTWLLLSFSFLAQLDNDTLRLTRLFFLAEIQFENSSRFTFEIAPLWDRGSPSSLRAEVVADHCLSLVKIPSSLSRNWIYYTLGAVAIWGATVYARNNPDKLANLFNNTKLGIHGFYENQVKVQSLIPT